VESQKSAFQTPITIKEVVENIHRKKYLLPAIQREVVWDFEQIIRLFDSVMREYTIGSFLFWDVNKETSRKFQFYEFVRSFHERDSRHNPKASITGEESIRGVLDGQQRFTALYIGLKGDYAYKVAWKRWDSDDAFPKRKLYLNLLSEAAPNDLDMKYDFDFLTDEEAVSENDNNTFWFEVGKVLNFKDHSEINDFLIDNNLNQRPKEQAKFANQTLFKLYQMINDAQIINFYLETSQELDKVLNIFIRVNSGGTPLSYSDILLSIASAQWKSRDAREEIISFVDEFKGKDKTLTFTKDDLDNLLNYEYNQGYTFMALSLLYPTLDFKNKFHIDHIHPKKYFKRHELAKLVLSDSQMRFYQENRDRLANLQLLEGVPNEEKSSKPLAKWLDRNFDSGELKDFLRKNHIPDVDLDFHNFEQFVEKRSELIKKRFKDILPMA